MVGVGDGPWDTMREFDDQLPARRFDNFQFVNYGEVMKRNMKNRDAGFAMEALMEIPGEEALVWLAVSDLARGSHRDIPQNRAIQGHPRAQDAQVLVCRTNCSRGHHSIQIRRSNMAPTDSTSCVDCWRAHGPPPVTADSTLLCSE